MRFRSIARTMGATFALVTLLSGMNTGVAHAQTLTFYTVTQTPFPGNLEKISFNVANASFTTSDVGSLGGPTIDYGGLAWDSANSTLYMVSNTSGQLYSINTTTAAATLIGSTGESNLFGLTYNATTNTLLAYDGTGSSTGGLYTVSATTGAATKILSSTVKINGLAYNTVANEYFGLVPNGDLYSIGTSSPYTQTAIGSATGTGYNVDNNGLVYDPTTGLYFGIDNSRNFFSLSVSGNTVSGTSYSTNIANGIPGAGDNPRVDGIAEVISSGSAAPEPGAVALIALGAAPLAGFLRRHRI